MISKTKATTCASWLVVSALLAGCGGGSRVGTEGQSSPPSAQVPDPGAPGTDPAPAPANYDTPHNDELLLQGFYDTDASGAARPVRNDLSGSLRAMLQFAQSHTLDPKGNEARNMPRLTSERAALLLVTPDPAQGEAQTLSVSVMLDGVPKGRLELAHPNALPRSDYNNNDGRPDYAYSRRAWSVRLPWDWVKPGLSLSVSDDQGRSGELAAADIDFAAPAQLVVHNIRLGMLTEPPTQTDSHWMLQQPEQAATDFFQTIPAARLTLARYEAAKFERVMVASGVVYTSASADSGDVYSGDMLESTAKSTVSMGINLANFGVSSSGMQLMNAPLVFQSVVAHHARGNYNNGVHSHGFAGRNGMLTLHESRGNAFSHEIGHHFNLGHYPGQNGLDYFWTGHHHDSGWGYLDHRHRLRANLHWQRDKTAGLSGMPQYDNTYSFATDPMAAGAYSTALSRYPHFTGYSLKVAIQAALDRPVPSAQSSTGYLQWDATTRRMQEVAPQTGTLPYLFYNSPDGLFLKPRQIGVPVFTLVGGYDPDTGNALLYPALRGNWGNVFDMPAPAAGASARQCWLEVSHAAGPVKRVALAATKRQTGSVNKLHVNLAQAEQPLSASLLCQEPGDPPTTLATLAIPQGMPAMPDAVVVGQESGYSALRRVELPRWEHLLAAEDGQDFIDLSEEAALLSASWGDDTTGLSVAAARVLQRHQQQEAAARQLNRLMFQQRSALQAADNAQAVGRVTELIDELGLRPSRPLPTPQPLLMGSEQHCLKATDSGAGPELHVAEASSCIQDNSERWVSDARGAVHSAAFPSYCLSANGTAGSEVTLARCDRSRDDQDLDLAALPEIRRAGLCLGVRGGSLTGSRGVPQIRNCTGSADQRWSGLTPSNNRLLALLNERNLAVLQQIGLR